jgi:ribose 5-phosphate isomerase B
MRVAIGADHGGYELKERVVEFLERQGYDFEDLGTHDRESVDYPDFGAQVARAVASGAFERGILICGTGIGMSMTANKVPGIRAAVCTDGFTARMARQHNDAQILCLGGRVLGVGSALEVVEVFLSTAAQGGRHARRVRKINALDADRA